MIFSSAKNYFILKMFLKRFLLSVFICLLFSNAANALLVEPYTDSTLDGYEILDGYTNNTSYFPHGSSNASLTTNVYYNTSTQIFLYDLTVNPADGQNISTVEAPVSDGLYFDNNLKAGHDSSLDFSIGWIPVQHTISFSLPDDPEDPDDDDPWKGTDGIDDIVRFYFESIYAPGLGNYYIHNGEAKYAENYAPDPDASLPVPEPGTLILLLTGFGCLTGAKFRLLGHK